MTGKPAQVRAMFAKGALRKEKDPQTGKNTGGIEYAAGGFPRQRSGKPNPHNKKVRKKMKRQRDRQANINQLAQRRAVQPPPQ